MILAGVQELLFIYYNAFLDTGFRRYDGLNNADVPLFMCGYLGMTKSHKREENYVKVTQIKLTC